MVSQDYLELRAPSEVGLSAGRRLTGTRVNTRYSLGKMWATVDVFASTLAGISALHFHGGGASVTLDRFLTLQWHYSQFWSILGFLLLYPVFVVGAGHSFGIYHTIDSRSFLNEQRLTLQAILTATLLLCGALFVSHAALYASRTVVALTFFQTAALAMATRGFWRGLRERRYSAGLGTRNVLIVGDGRAAQALRNHISALPHLGLRFKGFISMTPLTSQPPDDSDVIGDIDSCVPLARTRFAEKIFFATPADRNTIERVLDEARAFDIGVHVVPDLYDGLAWNPRYEFVGQIPTVLLHHGNLSSGLYALKRCMDIILSAAAILLLSPLMLLIALAVGLDTPGPILYRAARIGRKGREFTCFKFRTMVANAEQLKDQIAHLNERTDILFKLSKDPRVTRTGAWLRKYSLDEIPQLFNVLLGDMSLVGPRPPLASEVARYEIDHLKRLDVLPGITGLWQVEARQDPSFESYISLDTAYVDNWNLMLDLRILARTLVVVCRGTGC
jgi:exopolysaccharide biosynthesis polyprenyl glycosylphosphotransferase